MFQNKSNCKESDEGKRKTGLSMSWTSAISAGSFMAVISIFVLWPSNILDWIIVVVAVTITIPVVYFAVKPYETK